MNAKMKKILSLLICALMLMTALAACSSSGSKEDSDQQNDVSENANKNENKDENEDEDGNKGEAPETVTVNHALGTTEVPYSPQRVCVLDSSGMDIMVTLDLTDYVTCVQQPKGYASYLTDYYTSDTIIKLDSTSGGGGKSGKSSDAANAEGSGEGEDRASKEEGHGGKNRDESAEGAENAESADPYEVYYTIDADLIIGDVDTVDEELYEILSQIAPTVVTKYNIDHEDGVYAGALENARMIASIWGVEDRVDEIQAKYDPIYKDLGEALNGKTAIVLTSTSDSNILGVAQNDGWETDSEKLEYERSVRVVFDLGMDLLSNDIPAEVVEASEYTRGEEADTRSAKNKVIADWIEEVGPEYLIDVDRYYTSLEAAAADGNALTDLEGLTVTQNGNLCMLSYDGRIGSNGLHGILIQLDELSAFFLD